MRCLVSAIRLPRIWRFNFWEISGQSAEAAEPSTHVGLFVFEDVCV